MKRIINGLMILAIMLNSCAAYAQKNITSNKLTHGMVKKYIERGVTTQEEIIALFGGPNITTISKAGQEVWIYERISYTNTTQGGADPGAILLGSATGAGIGAIVGHQERRAGEGALIGGAVGGLAGLLAGWKNPVNEQGSRSVTLMLWFDGNDVVKDYSVMSTNY